MNIKQQKQIKEFLIEQFGPEKGSVLFDRQEKTLLALIKNEKGRSKSQMKTLTQRILPCIALYKTLLENSALQKDAYAQMQTYMVEKVAAKQHSSTAKMERMPGFYVLYSAIFRRVMRSSDLWKSTQSCEKESFDVTIQKCLWHTACTENGCAELCCLFCDVDNITYGGLEKIGFTRTKTLGYGGDCCDFHFFRK